jgi:hypothetical protein
VDIYKYAAQNGLRFPSARGHLTVEQLFGLPLKSREGFDLDSVARGVNDELKSVTQESFVEVEADNPRKTQIETALEVVKDVIKTKQAENAAVRARQEKAEKRRKLLDALRTKEDQELTTASREELEKKLAELD